MLELLVVQSPIAEVRYAQEMGKTQAAFQCEAFRRGAYTPDEMAQIALTMTSTHRVHQAMQAWQWYSDTGNQVLISNYINALQEYSLSNCPKEFNYYISK